MLNDATNYKLYYSGNTYQHNPWHIGMATSADGINWTKFSEPIIYVEEGMGTRYTKGDVIKYNSKYYLYYTRYESQGEYYIEGAVSDDGYNWSKIEDGPVIEADQSWEGQYLLTPTVIEEDGLLVMVYAVNNGDGFGLALSSDGLNWFKPLISRF